MKSEILNTAIELFRKEGMANVTIQQICDACHVTKGCFYHYYPSKESVLLDFYSSSRMNFGKAMADILKYQTYTEKLWNFYRYYVEESISMGPELFHSLPHLLHLHQTFFLDFAFTSSGFKGKFFSDHSEAISGCVVCKSLNPFENMYPLQYGHLLPPERVEIRVFHSLPQSLHFHHALRLAKTVT